MANTTTQSGTFVSTGLPVIIPIRTGIDWFKVWNYTQAGVTPTVQYNGFEFTWFNGMAPGTGIIQYMGAASGASAGSNVVYTDTLVSGGFTLLDTSFYTTSTVQVGTTPFLSHASSAVGTFASNVFLVGQTVRLTNVIGGLLSLNGIELTVTAVTGTTATFGYLNSTTGNGFSSSANTGFTATLIPNQPEFYPRRRTITSIVPGATTVVTLSVTHQFTVGQEVRFRIPLPYGTISNLDTIKGTIIAINPSTNTITLDTPSSGLVWAWPGDQQPLTFAQIVPVGENSPYVQNNIILNPQNPIADATVNRAILGMYLGTGGFGVFNPAQALSGPAGTPATPNDVIYWQGGCNFSSNIIVPLLPSQL